MIAKQEKSIVYLWPFQLFSLSGIAYSIYAYNWKTILFYFAIGYMLALTGELVGIHRYFAHRSFNVNYFWRVLLVIISTLAVSGPIVAWVNTHRNHHRNSDTEKDPHSPAHRGMINVFFANWWFYRYTNPKNIPEYNTDKLLKFTCDYYYHIHVCFIILLTLIDYQLLFPLYFYPSIIGSLISSVLNTYLHRNSKIHDSKCLAWIISGDAYHKYHHEHPMEWRLPFPDLCAILIKIIKEK